MLTASYKIFGYQGLGSDSPSILLDNVASKNPAPGLLVKFMATSPPDQLLFDYNRLNTEDEIKSVKSNDEQMRPGIEITNRHGKFELIGKVPLTTRFVPPSRNKKLIAPDSLAGKKKKFVVPKFVTGGKYKIKANLEYIVNSENVEDFTVKGEDSQR